MASLSKEEYLKRYMSGPSADEKKKKKKKDKNKGTNGSVKIHDEDAFITISSEAKNEESEDEDEIKITAEIKKKVEEAPKFKKTFAEADEDIKPTAIKREIDSDPESPTRCARHDSEDLTPPRRKRHDSEDASPPRRKRRDSDNSPRRRRSIRQSPVRRRRHDSDNSPPRFSGHGRSPTMRRRQRHDSDSDQSPQRTRRRSIDMSPRRRKDSDSSPVRKRTSPRRRKDSDSSPVRKRIKEEPDEPGVQRTLDGKVAGLQSAKDLRVEAEKLKAKQDKVFEDLDVETSGRYAEAVQRTKQVGRRKENPEDTERKEREAAKQAEMTETYKSWNKGVSQLKDREARLTEAARVAAEPLARTKDDEAMNAHLKEILLEDDPMAEFLTKKRQKDDIRAGKLIYPTYNGAAPPNRFGIRPGYRWDGVNRANGFEGKLAIQGNKKLAQDAEHYKYSLTYE